MNATHGTMSIYFITLVLIINMKSCVVEQKLNDLNTNLQQIKQGMNLYAESRND